MGTAKTVLREITLEVHLPSGHFVGLPVLIDDSFNITMHIPGLDLAMSNIKNAKMDAASVFVARGDKISVSGLLGSDILQFIKELKVVD